MTSNASTARNETFALIRQAVLDSLAGVSTRWEGVEISEVPSGKWLHTSMRHVTGRQSSLAGADGSVKWRRTGFVVAQCFAPMRQNGVVEATLMATVVRNSLQGQHTGSGVWFRNARITEVGIEKDWFRVDAVVDFEYEEIVNVVVVPGDPPPSSLPLTYQFPVPSTQWIINHNLGRRAGVEAYTTGGVQIWAQVVHISNNQSVVNFDTPQDGYAIIDY